MYLPWTENSNLQNTSIPITLGFNNDANTNKQQFGIFLYHNNRFVESLHKIGLLDGESVYGVLGCCDLPSSYLKLNKNKQGFLASKEYTALKQSLAWKLRKFVSDRSPKGTIDAAFWETAHKVPLIVSVRQCLTCLKWRKLTTEEAVQSPEGATWSCELQGGVTCETPEQSYDSLIHAFDATNPESEKTDQDTQKEIQRERKEKKEKKKTHKLKKAKEAKKEKETKKAKKEKDGKKEKDTKKSNESKKEKQSKTTRDKTSELRQSAETKKDTKREAQKTSQKKELVSTAKKARWFTDSV